MTTNRKKRSPLRLRIFGLAMLLAMTVCIGFASGAGVAAESTTTIDTLEVAFKKTDIGDSLASVLDFEDKAAKTLKVPDGANYSATLTMVCRDGQKENLWARSSTSLSWDRVENQLIEQNVAYCIRVLFEPKTGYRLSDDEKVLKQNLRVSGAELGKGKDIELWDTAGRNAKTTAVEMDFILSKGMTYVGYPATVYPVIGTPVTGKIGTLYTDTGIWLRGAPGPYQYTIKTAPVGTELQVSNVFDESTCYYRVTAVNAMDAGTMYITATASDGQICDIPVPVAAVSGGHEHTWSDFGKIDFGYHGYRQCTDPACPGVSPAFDKGSQYAGHVFYGDCNASCKTCGNLGNPDAKHSFSAAPDATDNTCHVYKCACGEVEKDADGNVKKETHTGGVQTCLSGAQCAVCGHEYLGATGHRYEFRSFSNNDGTYTHLGFCKYCGIENTELRHSPTGGTATCQARARCTYTHNGDVCDCVYGDFEAHSFVGGICSKCGSDEYIRDVVIDIPEFYKGMVYKPLFYPSVVKGNVIDMGIYWYKAATSRDANNYLCGSHNFDTTTIEENSVILYAFKPQTNCKFPASVEDVSVSVTHGEVLSKQIREHDGCLVVIVLFRVDSVVQSVDLDVSQPFAGNSDDTLKINENNGYAFTVNSIGPLDDGKIIINSLLEIELTIKAPAGKVFQSLISNATLENWLCDFHLSGGKVLQAQQNADRTELTLTIQTARAIECPHNSVTLIEAGRRETCTEDGVKDKYACAGCGKEFFDAACTIPWNDVAAMIPKEHLCKLHPATACSAGRDGSIAYYECRREDCGKLFRDAACSKEIMLADTVLHDFRTEWSSDRDTHFHECKNCDTVGDKAAHRPDRTAATENAPVKCLDCGYIITPALAHTVHQTTLVPGEDATCMKEGKRAYYKCSGCELKFEDQAAAKPIADESMLVLPKAHRFGAWVAEVSATETAEGVKGHKDCTFCGKHFDAAGTELTDLAIAKLRTVEVRVIGGTGGGRLTVGESVTVRANAPAKGQVFRGWQDADGTIVSTKMQYTFTVREGMTLTAVYGNQPAADSENGEVLQESGQTGLSGGAIAGIVIGSAAVAGIGGFAVFWFAIRKKTFAELIAVLKKAFSAIGKRH